MIFLNKNLLSLIPFEDICKCELFSFPKLFSLLGKLRGSFGWSIFRLIVFLLFDSA